MGSENKLPAVYQNPTKTIPAGTFYYKIVRRLESKDSNPDSLYPGLPIHHLYKQIRDGALTVESRYDDNEYWQPVSTLPYVIYETGDENTLVTFNDLSRSLRVVSKDKTLKEKSSVDHPPYFHAYYGGKIFIATTKFADIFGDKDQKKNPYTYRYIRLWTLHPDDDKYSFIDANGVEKVSYFYAVPAGRSPGSQYGMSFYPIKQEKIDISSEDGSDIRIGEETYSIARNDQGQLSETEFLKQFVTSDVVRESVKSALFEYLTKDLKKSPDAAVKEINRYATYANKQIKNDGSAATKGAYDNGQPRSSITVVRGTLGGRSGYVTPVVTGAENKPQIVQQYRLPDTVQPITRRHVFQFKPNQINYSGIGSDWTEIPRSANVPLVDWRSYKLLQVSFQFLVAPDEDGSLDDFRDEKIIKKSIDGKLRELRRMAVAPYPVYLLGFDEILSEQMRFPFTGGRGVEFVISEFNISSLLRTDDGKINRAQCDITLREIPIENVRLIDFPSLKFGKDIPVPKGKKGKSEEGQNDSYERTLNE